MPKQSILVSIIFLTLSLCSVAFASDVLLSGYVYSDKTGWISLSCSNTDSCDSISYGITKDDSGKLSGYGYSQEDEWVNFKPRYGGVSFNSNGSVSGWAFAEKSGWVKINSVKIFSLQELQEKLNYAKSIVDNYYNQNNISVSNLSSLLEGLKSILGK